MKCNKTHNAAHSGNSWKLQDPPPLLTRATPWGWGASGEALHQAGHRWEWQYWHTWAFGGFKRVRGAPSIRRGMIFHYSLFWIDPFSGPILFKSNCPEIGTNYSAFLQIALISLEYRHALYNNRHANFIHSRNKILSCYIKNVHFICKFINSRYNLQLN